MLTGPRFIPRPAEECRLLLLAAKMTPRRTFEERKHWWHARHWRFTADQPRASAPERTAIWASFSRWGHAP